MLQKLFLSTTRLPWELSWVSVKDLAFLIQYHLLRVFHSIFDMKVTMSLLERLEIWTWPNAQWVELTIFVSNKTTKYIELASATPNLMTNFSEKAKIFNKFLSKQCEPLSMVFSRNPIKMLKVTSASIIKSFITAFQNCLKPESVSDDW